MLRNVVCNVYVVCCGMSFVLCMLHVAEYRLYYVFRITNDNLPHAEYALQTTCEHIQNTTTNDIPPHTKYTLQTTSRNIQNTHYKQSPTTYKHTHYQHNSAAYKIHITNNIPPHTTYTLQTTFRHIQLQTTFRYIQNTHYK